MNEVRLKHWSIEGDVIQNDQGKDEAVLCPARWFDFELKSDLFENDQNDDIKKHPPKQVQDEISS